MLALKMRCNTIQQHPEPNAQERIELVAVSSDSAENASWSKWTPSGQLGFTVTNPDAFGKLEAGQEYIVTITPA